MSATAVERGTRAAADTRQTTIAATVLIALFVFVTSFLAARSIDPVLFEPRQFDLYLQGDLPRTFEQMVSRLNDGGRTGLHLLFPLVVHPMTRAWHALPGVSWLDAVRGTVATLGALWAVALFLCARAFGTALSDSVLVTLVGLAGASARFWLVVPETFLPGGVALLAAVAVAARSDDRALGDAWYISAGVATLGTTLTNWATGALMVFTTADWRRIVRICLQVFGATTLLWIAERLAFPSVQFIFDRNGVGQYITMPDLGRALDVGRVFFAHVAVAPQLEVCRNPAASPPYLVSIQGSAIGSAGGPGIAITLVWLSMLGLGLWSALRMSEHPRGRLVLVGSIASQVGLHLLYGGETFLYSMHWWGLLVILAALSFRTRARQIARILAVAFICAAAVHNWRTWEGMRPAFHDDFSGYPFNHRNCAA